MIDLAAKRWLIGAFILQKSGRVGIGRFDVGRVGLGRFDVRKVRL